jgi:predicted dehydrogenase
MKTHRVAIIGTGQSVNNHLTAIRKVGERVQLVAAVDLNESRVRAVAAEHEIPHWYTDSTEMLRAQQPDLVHIITPPATHKSLIIECLEAGSWVFCEKPLCASLAEFDEITRAEDQTRRYVSTVFQWRFGAAAKHLKRLIAESTLGKPLVGVCNTLWYRAQDYYRVPWRGKWATEVGGPSATLGIHLTDLFLWLMGDWVDVHALIGTLDRDIEVEDVAMAMVRFQNGAMGSIINSALSPRQETYMRLDFQKATVEVSALYRYENDHWRFTQPDNALEDVSVHWKSLPALPVSGHAAQLSEILDSFERGQRPPVSGDEARRILEFLASLYKSALTGQPVTRGSISPEDPFYHSMNGSTQGVAAT